jgi:hypothetical protein
VSPGASPRLSPGKRPGVSIELAGIPGSGKSRRVRALAAGLTARGVAVHQPQALVAPSIPSGVRSARKAVACGAAALGDPATTARIIRAVVRSGQPEPADVAGRTVQWLVAQRTVVAARRREGVSILDEGLVQALWSIGLRGDVEPVLRALASRHRVPTSDLVVVVRVPPELALARLTARTSRHSRTQHLAERDRLAELQGGARLLEHLVEWWSHAALSPTRVVSVSGADDSAADRALLVDRVCELLDENRPLRGEDFDPPH